jgi:two-component system phosphate regulon sensor histidine kinase PhoR
MKEIRRQFYGLYFAIVVAFVLLLYFLLTTIVEDRLIEHQQSILIEDITSITRYIEDLESQTDLNEEMVIEELESVSPLIHGRLTFLTMDGTPLFDSEVNLNEIGNLMNQGEIQQVINGAALGRSNGERSSNNTSDFYVAQPVLDENAQPLGILRMSSEITDATRIIRESFLVLMAGILVLGLVIIIIARDWINRLARSFLQMEDVIDHLIKGDYNARYVGHSYREIDDLGSSLNELALNLDHQEMELELNQERTSELINHLIIGVMLLDENRRVQIVNPAMNELLGTNLYSKLTHTYTDHIKSAELIELIEEAYTTNEMVNNEIIIYFPEEKTLDANVIPVPSRNKESNNYIVLLYDISEIRRLENIRTDFAANVSHELRTPITALKGFSETLLDGAMYDEEVLKEFLEIMLRESTRLDLMVQDILQLSRIEHGQVKTNMEWLPIRDVVNEVFQILQQKIELKNMTTIVEDPENVVIYANHDQLKQVLMNLIANAISYTPENGNVLVDVTQEHEEAKIQVIDNGIGIPKQDQARIFERFYRVSKARSRNAGGTGLGLSIVRWVVENMNGHIELYSEVNVGTTFVVWLPIKNKK